MTRSSSFDSARAFRSYLYHDETEGRENVTEDLYRNQIAVTILNSITVVPTVFLNALVMQCQQGVHSNQMPIFF